MRKTKFLLFLMSIFLSVPTIAQTVRTSKGTLPCDSLIIRKIGLDFDDATNRSAYINGEVITTGKVVAARYLEKKEWSSNICFIEVRNMQTGEIRKIYRNDKTQYSESDKSFYKNYIKTNTTGTKGSNLKENVLNMRHWLSQTFYMTDNSLIISSYLTIDESHTYVLKPVNQQVENSLEQSSEIVLFHNPKEPFLMYILNDNLEKIGVDIKKGPCTFRIEYLDIDNDIRTFITDEFRIEEY